MSHVLLQKKREAIRLRRLGWPYSSIKEKLSVNKSTLSYWLRAVPLGQKHQEAIKANWITRRIESYRQTVTDRNKNRERAQYEQAHRDLGKITERDIHIAGLFLYLGEGEKSDRWNVGITNSDPAVIRFAVGWMTKVLRIPKENIRVRLHLYRDMDIAHETQCWSHITGIPVFQFRKPHIKRSLLSGITYHTHGHGTCNVQTGNGPVKQRITAETRVLLDTMRP